MKSEVRKLRGPNIYSMGWQQGVKEMEFKLYDKNGKVRAKILLDEEDMKQISKSIDRCLNA